MNTEFTALIALVILLFGMLCFALAGPAKVTPWKAWVLVLWVARDGKR